MLSNSEFEAIYAEFKKTVYNLALSYVHNQEDAQDIAQEVFVKIYQRYDTYNPAGGFPQNLGISDHHQPKP